MVEQISCRFGWHGICCAVYRCPSGLPPPAARRAPSGFEDNIDLMRFAKGHGTGNDFVILPDADGRLDLTADLTAALCDRHFGIGADGVLRVVRSAAAGPDAGGQAAEWFMDYRNADGSVAEMCGNGIRVFAKFLHDEGLASEPQIAIVTRAGVRTVRAEADGQFTVDMGPAAVLGDGAVRLGSHRLEGLAVTVGNPHVACMIDRPVADVDLSDPLVLSPAELTGGANVEVIRLIGPNEIQMRVHERGSGLTLSCGTGAVAAAVAAASASGDWPAERGRPWTVHVPGGRLTVSPSAIASLLTGPADIVAAGELSDDWLAGLSPVRLSTV